MCEDAQMTAASYCVTCVGEIREIWDRINLPSINVGRYAKKAAEY